MILLCVYTELCLLVTSFFLILLARFNYSLTERRLINIQCSETLKKSSRDRADCDRPIHSNFIAMKESPQAKNAEFFCYGRVLLLYFSSKTPIWAFRRHFGAKDLHDNVEGYNFCLWLHLTDQISLVAHALVPSWAKTSLMAGQS